MAEQTNEIIIVAAKWSDDVHAYVATIDGKTVIISNDKKAATTKTAPSVQTAPAGKPVSAARQGKARPQRRPRSHASAPRLRQRRNLKVWTCTRERARPRPFVSLTRGYQ
jgi:hypothetical protein